MNLNLYLKLKIKKKKKKNFFEKIENIEIFNLLRHQFFFFEFRTPFFKKSYLSTGEDLLGE
jgi:hypothetical protein